MTRYAIYGAGGFGREVRAMLDAQKNLSSFAGFIDDYQFVEPIPDQSFDDVLIAIAKCADRQKIAESWKLKKVQFKSLISEDVIIHSSVKIDIGCIICPGTKLTVDIQIGAFGIINLNSTIGHDVVIGNFCSLMPSVNISGGVKIGAGSFIGSGATVLQGISLGEGVIVGAGAVVTRDVAPLSVVAGVPARSIRKSYE